MKNKLWTSMIMFLTATMLTSVTAKAMDFGTLAAGAGMVKGGIDAIVRIADAVDWVSGRICHNWWACEYEDGLVVYNSFQARRDFENVFRYFTGQSEGDCDSFYLVDYVKYEVCYQPSRARQMIERHGKIVEIRREMPPSPPQGPGEGIDRWDSRH